MFTFEGLFPTCDLLLQHSGVGYLAPHPHHVQNYEIFLEFSAMSIIYIQIVYDCNQLKISKSCFQHVTFHYNVQGCG